MEKKSKCECKCSACDDNHCGNTKCGYYSKAVTTTPSKSLVNGPIYHAHLDDKGNAVVDFISNGMSKRLGDEETNAIISGVTHDSFTVSPTTDEGIGSRLEMDQLLMAQAGLDPLVKSHPPESWEEEFDKLFPTAVRWEIRYRGESLISKLKSFISKILATEKSKIIKEIGEKIERMKSGQKINRGHECYDSNCKYCENILKDDTIDEFLALLKNFNRDRQV